MIKNRDVRDDVKEKLGSYTFQVFQNSYQHGMS